MEISFLTLSLLLILLSVLPFIRHPHWIFRVPEFLKLQILVLQVLVFPLTFLFVTSSAILWVIQVIQFSLMAYHTYIFARYTRFWKNNTAAIRHKFSERIKIVSCNVYQYNTEYDRFVNLIHNEKPDVFLTMESDEKWESAIKPLEKDYPYQIKVPLENTYGMHFYSRLKIIRSTVHYFVADDLPSIETELESPDGNRFICFGVHPPPPSPTEEETSRERDGDLLSVAKKIRNTKLPVVVIGDFNNVAWARSSVLFRKTGELIDARIGRGILSTFHAGYWFFRVPLDLLFHTPEIFIDRLYICPSIGSDHFPVGCEFHINLRSEAQEDETEQLEKGEMKEVNELIEAGKAEESTNREES